MEADKDHLITEDTDAAYRKCPGVNNVAYVVSNTEEVGKPFTDPAAFLTSLPSMFSSRTLTKAQDPLTGVLPPQTMSSQPPLPLLPVTPLPHHRTCPHSPPSRKHGSRCTPCWTTPSLLCRPLLRAALLGSLSQGSTATLLTLALQVMGRDLGVFPTKLSPA